MVRDAAASPARSHSGPARGRHGRVTILQRGFGFG